MSVTATPSPEPGRDEAALIVRTYYARVSKRDFAAARAMWDDNGEASGLSPEAFAERFNRFSEFGAEVGTPDAINALSSDQTSLKFKLALLQALPAVIQQTVEPMKAIDGIKIIQVDGLNRTGGSGADGAGPAHTGSNLAEQAMSAALSYRAHAPLIDSLLNEIGLSGGSLQGLVPGVAGQEKAAAADAAKIGVSPQPHAAIATSRCERWR